MVKINEMGILVQTSDDPELIDRPKVCLLTYGDGEYRKEKVVDLKETVEKTGTYKRSVLRTLDPKEYNIVAEFLI